MSPRERFARLSTAAKLLLILTAAILPIGIALTWVGESGIREANAALEGRTQDQTRTAARAIESLIARNALALRIAANGALAGGTLNACDRVRDSLAIAPAISQDFELETAGGRPLCASGDIGNTGALPLVAPADIRLRVSPDSDAIAIRVGVIGGMATALIPTAELRGAVAEDGGLIPSLVLLDGNRELRVVGPPQAQNRRLLLTEWPIGNGTLIARVGTSKQRITTLDRLMLLLPVVMWVAAALITWFLVTRL